MTNETIEKAYETATEGCCIWCDDGTSAETGDRLCHFCRSGPKDGCGCVACVSCRRWKAEEAARRAALEAERATRIERLRSILRAHVRDLNVPWRGMEFGKAVLGALEGDGCDRGEELRRAVEEAKR